MEIYEVINDEVIKFCGELTEEIVGDEFEYTKYTECWHTTEETFVSASEKIEIDN